MMEKKHIKDLTLSWSRDADDDVEDTRSERDVLANLQPHWDLQELEINGYRGTIFPDWLGSPSYHNMTCLHLKDCKNCCMLPPLGQLPTLKKLQILGLEKIVSIGEEFLKGNGNASIIPFPSLEFLLFSCMTSWEQWNCIDMEAFPKLCHLKISFCPKLVGNLPCQLPSLQSLEIDTCPLFVSCIPRYPKLHVLELQGSGNLVWQEQELPPSLWKLEIEGCQMLESLLDALSKHLHLQQLTISGCSNISTPMIHLPQSLQHLMVLRCENVDFVMSSSTAPLQNLQSITFWGCNFVKFTSDDMECLLPNFRELHISFCTQMEAFPEGVLVPSLRELHLEFGSKLLSHQAEWHLLSNITHLRIYYYPFSGSGIKCFPDGLSLPTTITTLELTHFKSLETLNCTGLQHLTSLQQLYLMNCPKLEKMSGEKLPCSLRKLHIWDCPLLEEKYHNKDEQLLRQISHIPLITLFQR